MAVVAEEKKGITIPSAITNGVLLFLIVTGLPYIANLHSRVNALELSNQTYKEAKAEEKEQKEKAAADLQAFMNKTEAFQLSLVVTLEQIKGEMKLINERNGKSK